MQLDDITVGTIAIGGLRVRRLGYGAMRVTGARNTAGVRDRAEAIRIYRRAYERGVTFIDTANIYGYGESEEILAEALHPYPDDLVIGTKAGFRPGKIEPGKTSLPPLGQPGHIKEECDKSLRRLRLDHIDLYQVHVPDPGVPYEDTVGAFAELQQAGKVRHIGVSNVTLEQLAVARSLCTVVSVQNAYNVGTRTSENLLEACEEAGMAFLPWKPIQLEGTPAAVAAEKIAAERGITNQQVALAWALAHSPAMLPIPGTSKLAHLDENIDAAFVELSKDEIARLESVAAPA
jgi:aryl-alcohol dehydrogenase-like predicted oxidoreductase